MPEAIQHPVASDSNISRAQEGANAKRFVCMDKGSFKWLQLRMRLRKTHASDSDVCVKLEKFLFSGKKLRREKKLQLAAAV